MTDGTSSHQFRPVTRLAFWLIAGSLIVLAIPQLVNPAYTLPASIRGLAAILALTGVILTVTNWGIPPESSVPGRALALFQPSAAAPDKRSSGPNDDIIDVVARDPVAAKAKPADDAMFGITVLMAIAVPCVAMLIMRRPTSAVVCMLLQLTGIGWFVALVWAVYRTVCARDAGSVS